MKQGGMHVLGAFLFILILFLFIGLIVNANNSNNSNDLGKHDVNSFIINWLRLTTKGDPYAVANLFSNNSILFATVSNQFIDTPQQILEYFKFFVGLSQLNNEIVKKDIIKIDNNTYGFYAIVNWSWKDGSKPVNKQARMSFIVKGNNKNKLKIHSLHSSELPSI